MVINNLHLFSAYVVKDTKISTIFPFVNIKFGRKTEKR